MDKSLYCSCGHGPQLAQLHDDDDAAPPDTGSLLLFTSSSLCTSGFLESSSGEKSLLGKGMFRGESRDRLLSLLRGFVERSSFSLGAAAIAAVFEGSLRRMISRLLFL